MGITGGIDTEERSRSTATTLKKESPSSHSMKTAIVLASVALLAAISNHGCESAPAENPKPKVNRVLVVKDRYLKEIALDLDDWIEQGGHTMEERVKYLEDWASHVGWDLYDVHDSAKNIGSKFYELYDDFWDWAIENDFDALRKKLNDVGFNVEEKCEEVWRWSNSMGQFVREPECTWEITVNGDYNYDYDYDYDRRVHVEKKTEE